MTDQPLTGRPATAGGRPQSAGGLDAPWGPPAAAPLIRAARWPEDESRLGTLDTSFTSDRVYRVRRGPLSFELVEETVTPPLRKSYGSLLDDVERLRGAAWVGVAEAQGSAEDGEQGALAGLASVTLSPWNRRAHLDDLFVAPATRGRGVGRALVHAAAAFGRERGARCLWLETQDINLPAVDFYRRVGFRLCGLDERLYNPARHGRDEVALFFALDL